MNKKATNRTGFLGLAVLALGLLPAVAGAAVLLYEPFSYPDGPLVGNDGWANHSGTVGQLQVSSGRADLIQSAQSEDCNVPIGSRGLTDKTYYSYKLTVVGAPSLTSSTYFTHFRYTGDPGPALVFPCRVFIMPPAAGGNFTLGISASGNTPTAIGTDFAFGSTHQVVAAWDAALATAQLWVDPANESSPSVTHTAAVTFPQADRLAFREASGPVSEELIDDLIVGETFDDVINVPTATAPSTWGRIKAAYR